MNRDRVQKIAEAVLYEGYMLYPYRASAVKNQQRWNFGVLCPQAYSEAQDGSEAWTMQTECLLEGDSSTRLDVTIRFLQIVNRSVGRLIHPVRDFPGSRETESALPECELVDKLQAGGQIFTPWQEAMEREVVIPLLYPAAGSTVDPLSFEFSAGRELEPVCGEDGWVVGVVLREWNTLSGSVEVKSEQCEDGLFKAVVRICNRTVEKSSQPRNRAGALMDSLVSTHTFLGVENGKFVSLIDPPDGLKNLAAECRNQGTWPVLAGEEGERNTMLSSPIILYDYPQIAPESPGGLFDGTEIDEILSLRILTMTEEEKDEMRQSDQRAREILERTENMPPEQFMKLHGVLRGLRPAEPARETR
jgi:hypothetical protein